MFEEELRLRCGDGLRRRETAALRIVSRRKIRCGQWALAQWGSRRLRWIVTGVSGFIVMMGPGSLVLGSAHLTAHDTGFTPYLAASSAWAEPRTAAPADHELDQALRAAGKILSGEPLATAPRSQPEVSQPRPAESAMRALQVDLQTLTSERDALRTALGRAQTELVRVQTDVEAAEATATTLRTHYRDTTEALAQLRVELQTIKNALKTQLAETDSVKKLHEQLAQKLSPIVRAKAVTFRHEPNRLIIALERAALFQPGWIVLHDKGRQTLDQIALVLRDYPDYSVRVEGHIHAGVTGGSDAKGWAAAWRLSALQAASTALHLDTQRVASKRFAAIGSVYHRLKMSPGAEDGRVNRRRIEITLYKSGL